MIDTIKGALILLAASTLLINMGACQSKTPKAASEEQITADSGDQNGDRSATPSADADASPSDATEDNEIDLFGDHLVDWNELEKTLSNLKDGIDPLKEIRENLCISKKSLFYLFKFIFADPFLQVNFLRFLRRQFVEQVFPERLPAGLLFL